MIQKIELDEIVYALCFSPKDINTSEKKTTWLAKQTDSLQASLMCYDKKHFAIHKHKLNPRLINYSQEAFIVLQGEVQIDIYEKFIDEDGLNGIFGYKPVLDTFGRKYVLLGTLTAKEKDIIIVWKGYHAVKFMTENTLAYELKAGSFNGIISEDKHIIKLEENND